MERKQAAAQPTSNNECLGTTPIIAASCVVIGGLLYMKYKTADSTPPPQKEPQEEKPQKETKRKFYSMDDN